jgi:hypothetical protein
MTTVVNSFIPVHVGNSQLYVGDKELLLGAPFQNIF